MNIKSTNFAVFMLAIFVIALISHAVLAISFAVRGQYLYIVALTGFAMFLGVQLRNAWKQIKAINQRMDAILSKSK